MKRKLSISFIAENTIFYVFPSSTENSFSNLENKMKEYNIEYIDDYHSDLNNAFQINLKDNLNLPQKSWDKFFDYINERKLRFIVKSKSIYDKY